VTVVIETIPITHRIKCQVPLGIEEHQAKRAHCDYCRAIETGIAQRSGGAAYPSIADSGEI